MMDFITETAVIEGREVKYSVKRRSPEETARLVRLRDRLNPERTYIYTCTAKGRRVDLTIKADSMKDAATQGREILDTLAAPRVGER